MKYSLMTASMIFPILWNPDMDDATKKDEYTSIMKMIATTGVDAVEVTSLELDILGKDFINRTIKDANLEISGLIHMDNFADRQKSKTIVEESKRKILIANELGIKYVMLGLRAQEDFIFLPKDEMQAALVDNFSAVVEFGKTVGVTVTVEDTPNIKLPVCDSEDLLYLLEKVNYLKLTYDTGNMILKGENTIDFFDKLKDYVTYVHLKDMQYTDDSSTGDETINGSHVKATIHGEGVMDFRQIIRRLQDSGYNGWLMIEYVGQNDHAHNIKNTLTMMKKYEKEC